jgi:hypothetical protein
MPMDVAVVVLLIASLFVIFAAALAYADYQTSHMRKDK